MTFWRRAIFWTTGSSGAILVFENLWAERFATAVRNANGRVVDNARIPMDVVEAAMAALAE